MNKLNKKGFTLVEILATISILAIIIIIVATNGFGVFDKAKAAIEKENYNSIKKAANVLMTEISECDEEFDSELINDYAPNDKKTCYDLKVEASKCIDISLKYLLENQYIKGEGVESIYEKNPDYFIKGCLNLETGKIAVNDDAYDDYLEEKYICKDIELDSETLAYKIVCDAKKVTDGKIVDENKTEYDDDFDLNNIIQISSESERILGTAEDDYGTSYVFRGNITDNYIDFAGFIWRIVRINGDGSIRIVLDGSLDTVKRVESEAYAGTTSPFALKDVNDYNDARDNAYIGYMYGVVGISHNTCIILKDGELKRGGTLYGTQEKCEAVNGEWLPDENSAYNAAQRNLNDSAVKIAVDTFYESYIEGDTYHYAKYLADNIFCGDKTLAPKSVGKYNHALGYGYAETWYSAAGRLWYKEGLIDVTTATPTLECAKGATNTYSRYTSIIEGNTTTTRGVEINNALKYPIALLSADEIVMAGAWKNTYNTSYYLYNSIGSYRTYTMSSKDYGGGYVSRFTIGYNGGLSINTSDRKIRPVINLKANSMLVNGDGTKDNPYKIY